MSGAALYSGIVSQKHTGAAAALQPPGNSTGSSTADPPLPECCTQQFIFTWKNSPAEQHCPESSETEHNLVSLNLPFWLKGSSF